MRIVGAFFARSGDVNGGLGYLLGVGVNRIVRFDYPSALDMPLVLVVEVEVGEESRGLRVEMNATNGDEIEPSGMLGSISGSPAVRRGIVPTVLPTQSFLVPREGEFAVTVYLDGTEPFPVYFSAETEDLPAS